MEDRDNLEIFSITESKVSLKITATYDKPFSVFGDKNAYFVTQETLATLILPALNVDYVIYVQASDPANTKQLSSFSAIVKVLSPVANVTDIKSYAT